MKDKKDWQTIGYLYRRFLAHRWRAVVFVVIISFISGSLLSLRPLVLAPAIDSFATIKGEPASSISDLTLNNIGPSLLALLGVGKDNVLQLGVTIALLFVGVTIIIAALSLVGQSVLIRLKTYLAYDMSVALHEHMLSLPLSFFHNQKAGDLVSRIIHDVKATANSMESLARGLMVSITQVSVTTIILFKTDPILAAVIVGLGAVHIGITKTLAKKVRSGSHEVAEKAGEVGSVVQESVVGIRITKTFATEKYESKKVSGVLENYRNAARRFGLFKYYEIPMRMVADSIVIGGVILIVFYGVASGRLTLAGAAMFVFLSQQMTVPLGDIFSKLLGLSAMLGGAQRILKIFRTINPMQDGSLDVLPLKNKISIKDIRFGYDKDDPVLENVSLEIEKGQMVALVGASGAGKSTLADLILRLDDVDKGSILYDGINIIEFNHEAYRRKFGVVFQECLLFNATARENILLDRTEDESELQHAIWAANAKEFIEALPEGLDTIVGDRGTRLSGGQRQRIAIARAIYGRPSILVLDEATSALDSESEKGVQEAIDRVSREVTTIVIAHRLSTVQHADRIVILGKGKIEAIGAHSKLLEISPTYKRLCQLQFMQDSPSDNLDSAETDRVTEHVDVPA